MRGKNPWRAASSRPCIKKLFKTAQHMPSPRKGPVVALMQRLAVLYGTHTSLGDGMH